MELWHGEVPLALRERDPNPQVEKGKMHREVEVLSITKGEKTMWVLELLLVLMFLVHFGVL